MSAYFSIYIVIIFCFSSVISRGEDEFRNLNISNSNYLEGILTKISYKYQNQASDLSLSQEFSDVYDFALSIEKEAIKESVSQRQFNDVIRDCRAVLIQYKYRDPWASDPRSPEMKAHIYDLIKRLAEIIKKTRTNNNRVQAQPVQANQ